MFVLAFVLGIFSYLIFFLGIAGLLYGEYVIVLTTLYVVVCLVLAKFFGLINLHNISRYNVSLFKDRANPIFFIFVLIIILQGMVNLVGALGPELAFDALWYHLTLPKIYLQNHSISYIPGGLLYYSSMPKLSEMLYTAALSVSGEIFAKIIHYSFGVLTVIAVYKLSRKFCSKLFSLFASVIFYSNLVVGWESITAYVDLTRAFFETLSFWAFINWFESDRRRWLIVSAIMAGFAISTKLLAVGSLVIFFALVIYCYRYKKSGFKKSALYAFVYLTIALSVPLPWFVFSFINTGNPIYPFFTSTYSVGLTYNIFNPLTIIKDLYTLFLGLADPISPIYLIVLPFIVLGIRKYKKIEMLLVIYFLFSLIFWYITPKTGGGRFILPYLPVWSVLVAITIFKIKDLTVINTFTFVIIVLGVLSIAYRGFANYKYLPVIFGIQTKNEFLEENLNFSFGDFYDINDEIKSRLRPSDRVLLYGLHNLYYVDFPFIHESYEKRNERFTHILVQQAELPKKFIDWELIYENSKTNIKLYKK